MQVNKTRYRHWNYTTACCFKYKGNCLECPNNWVCKQIKGALPNEYGIHPAKYAMLMTYANSDQPYTVGFERSPRLKGVEND